MKEFEQVRGNLIDMLEDLDNKLVKVTDNVNLIHNNNITKDIEQKPVEENCDEKIEFSSTNSLHEGVNKIKLALSKIDNDHYGTCAICRKPIKKEDLDTIPFSNRCIHCAKI